MDRRPRVSLAPSSGQRVPLSGGGGRDTHDGHENSPILVFFSNLLGMAVAIAWLPGPAGTRRRVAKLSVEEPDAAEPARPDLWGLRLESS